MKATKAEVAKRVEEVLQIRLAGAEFADVREYARENEWGVSDGQLRRYIRASDQLLAEGLERDRTKLLARHIAQRRTLFARALQLGDYRTCLAIAKDEAQLEQLYEVYDRPPGPEPAGGPPTADTADIVNLLAGRLRQIDQTDLPAAEKARLMATLADSLLRAVATEVIDKRLEALQVVLLARKDKTP